MRSNIQEFYSKIQFPGHYTIAGLDYHSPSIRNKYLQEIDSVLVDNINVLDIGCGTGLISNLFARKYPNSTFTGVDFSDSVDYAKQFAATHEINNTKFIKQDFLNFESGELYDVVISQGVLHHIPDYNQAIKKIKTLVKPHGYLVIGLYHPFGKILKQLIDINYKNQTLYLDQEENPFETSFSTAQVKTLFNDFKLVHAYPSTSNVVAAIHAFFNYRNGGLSTYVFQRD